MILNVFFKKKLGFGFFGFFVFVFLFFFLNEPC